MKRNSKTSLDSITKTLLPHLRHPTKLRLILCSTIVVCWYALFFAPLSDQIAETKTLIDKERKRVTIAREIDQLKAKLLPYEQLIPLDADANELRRHVTDHIRKTPLNLLDIRPGKAKAIGPFDLPTLLLSVEGKYRDIDNLLAWVENDQRLLRVDTIKLSPATKTHSNLFASLTVLGLIDKSSTDVPKAGVTALAKAKKDASGALAPNATSKSPNARPKAGADPSKKAGEVRKKGAERRAKVIDALENAGVVSSPPSTTAKSPPNPSRTPVEP
jgi:hypothetical protein